MFDVGRVAMLNKAMLRANVRFNYEDCRLLPEDKRYEILDGDLRIIPTPGIQHQRISIAFSAALFQKLSGLGTVLEAPCDVLLSNEDIVQPDILFVRKERNAIVGKLNIQGAPDLVVEILSPATRTNDFEAKRKIYSRFGVQECWIVDPAEETVEVLVWSEIGYVTTGVYKKAARLYSPLLPSITLPLSEIFQK
jgi:Uma2 family endonuclease